MRIFPSSRFLRRFKRLPRVVQERAAVYDALFRANPFDTRLDTHKLHGKKKEEWLYSVNRLYRITFTFVSSDAVLYTDIGTHDEIYK